MNEASGETTQVTVEEAIRAAIALHRGGLLDDAEALYQRVLETAPASADALHFLGLLLRQRERRGEALDLMRKAVAAAPDFASAHNNLGNLLCEAGELEEAADHLQRALELEPNDPRVFNNLGNIARAAGDTEAAIRCFERALELSPEFPLPYENLGRIYIRAGDIARAHTLFCKAVALDESLSHSRQFVGMALCELGRFDEARKYYEKWIAAEPDNPVPRHLLASVAEGAPPARATDEYVRTVFDTFAATFDVHLQRLQYRAPALVVDALRGCLSARASAGVVLDAGCGTGLCGPLLRPLARVLDGVDLSPRMLDQARASGHYDALFEAELTRFMREHPEGYDAITCADTLCYFGELDEVAQAAASALRPGGRFVFTVEALDAASAGVRYRMNSSGRYAHAEHYVRSALRAAGLALVAIEHPWLRMEIGKEVSGLLVVALRARA
ncbi:MAG: tetratricopeptide repeat protein [Burkholderiales bacterium]|nr:tetratricopeptide repeat protein [Burkholderiales bacterium]